MLKETIQNYNIYGNYVEIVKIFKDQDELINYNSDKSLDKVMNKDDDKINNKYEDILTSIIQYTIEDLSTNDRIKDIYINHKTKIMKDSANMFLLIMINIQILKKRVCRTNDFKIIISK